MQGKKVAPMGLGGGFLVWISTNSPLLRSFKKPHSHLLPMCTSAECQIRVRIIGL